MNDDPLITPAAILAVLALVLSCMAVAAFSPRALAPPDLEARTQRMLSVQDSVHDGMTLSDAGTGAVIARFETEGDLFAMTALRSVTGRIGARPETGRFTVLLIERPDGTGVLQDPATGRTMPLAGFGPDNAAALLSLMEP